MITTTNTAPIATTSGWLPTAPSTHTFPAGTADGAKTLYAWAKDAVGNVSQSRNDNVMLDTTAPAINTFTIPAYSTSRSISVSVLTIDDIAAKFIITESATPPTTSAAWASVPAMPFIYETPSDGIKILYAWAKDTAGNISLSHSQHITVDTTAPVVTTLSLPVASNTLTDIPLTITATDAVGVTGYSIATTIAPPTTASAWTPTAPTTHTFPAGTIDGAYTLYAWAKDAAGQISAAKSVTILIDRVVPTMTAFIVPTTSASRDVAITTFTPSETLARTRYIITESNTPPLVTASGWSETIPATYPAPTDGSKILYAWVKDAAGNISPVFTGQSIIVDATAPVITTFAVPTRVNTLNLPNITLTATDVV
jgi:hypothetical protein